MADRDSSRRKKTCNFERYLLGSLYSTFKTSFEPYTFHNKRFQTLFMDQLDVLSKATCSFKNKLALFKLNIYSLQKLYIIFNHKKKLILTITKHNASFLKNSTRDQYNQYPTVRHDHKITIGFPAIILQKI